MTKKTLVSGVATFRLRAWPIISDAVEEAVEYGVARAFKHVDDLPTEDQLRLVREGVYQEVMNKLADIIDFGDD